MNELELATTDELVEELSKRCNGMVVMLAQDDDPEYTMSYFLRGGFYRCVGMVERVRFLMQQNGN